MGTVVLEGERSTMMCVSTAAVCIVVWMAVFEAEGRDMLHDLCAVNVGVLHGKVCSAPHFTCAFFCMAGSAENWSCSIGTSLGCVLDLGMVRGDAVDRGVFSV